MVTYEIKTKPTKHGHEELKIYYDDDPLNPRMDFDNLGFMVCLHRRYNLGDKHGFKNSEEIKEFIRENKIKSVLSIYAYEHSGITINTAGFSCRWDSGQIGFIWVSDEDIRREFRVKRISSKLRDQIDKILDSEVKTYDQFLTGDIYGYTLTEFIRINPRGEFKEVFKDSCSGFYGSNFEENGLYEYAGFKGVQ